MPAPRLASVAAAFVARGFVEASRDRLSAAISLASIVAALLSSFFLAGFIGPGAGGVARYGGYFGFAVVGFAALDLFATAASAASRRVREAQLAGTLDALLATPTPEAWVVALLPAWDLCVSFARACAYVLIAAVTLGMPVRANVPAFALALVLTLAAFVPLGLCGAAVTMRLRRGDPLSLFLAMAASVFGGVMVPVASLPPWARLCAQALPITHSLDALRGALLEGATTSDLGRPLALLAVCSTVLWLAGGAAFSLALRRARADGSLTSY